jgi:(1->4)-alpha-D-glucan 1-alpha-D-glucosylmutase
VQEYIVKAAREAKRHTCWTDPDATYERALRSHVSTLVRDQQFCDEMSHFVERIAPAAATNSLAMMVLKCVAPGVPDFYQGTELWDYSLTDPDNRRPVDFARRRSALDRLPAVDTTPSKRRNASRQLLSRWSAEPHKHNVTRETLSLRKQHGDLFALGAYEDLDITGPRAAHALAIARHRGEEWALAVVARQSITVAGPAHFPIGERAWGSRSSVQLPPSAPTQYRDIFTGTTLTSTRGRLNVADCLEELPIAVLVGV